MNYRQHRLDNGLEILAECNPRAYMSAFGFFVKTGARDETPDIGGVSHFLEHMVFKGTPNRTAEEVNLKLDEMGSFSNARTGEESTIYHSAVLPEFQTSMVELLADIMRPSLRDEDFETEKQVIVEEIRMYADQPPYGGFEKIMEKYFGEHPLAQSVLGTENTVTGLTPEKMHEYFQRRYSPGNIALCAAGNIDFDQLVKDADQFCGHWQSFDADRKPVRHQGCTGFETIIKPNAHQQYILQMANGPSANDPERYAVRVMNSCLSDDSGSRMYWEFLDSGAAESAGMAGHEYFDTGSIITYLCCDPKDAGENLKRLNAMQTKAAEEGITQRELDLAKRKIASGIVLASERTESLMFSVGGQWLNGYEYKTAGEIAERYEQITLDDVNAALAKYVLTENMTLVVGPRDDLAAAC